MAINILIADDSSTIQKVIKITLAEEPYEIFVCNCEEELTKKLKTTSFDLILLDFNLSTEKTGYELSQMVRQLVPQSAIMVLLGTFDSVDLDELEQSGVDDMIVKPFESSSFVQKCRELLSDVEDRDDEDIEEDEDNEDDGEDEDVDEDDVDEEGENDDKGEQVVPLTEMSLPDKIEEGEGEFIDEENEEEDWVVTTPKMDNLSTQQEIPGAIGGLNEEDDDSLEAEVKNWGMEIPPAMGDSNNEMEDEFSAELPDVIGDISQDLSPNMPGPITDDAWSHGLDDDMSLPSENDLEYPSIIETDDDLAQPKHQLSSKLVPADQLLSEDFGDEEDMDTVSFEITDQMKAAIEEEVNREQDSDDFWSEDDEDLILGKEDHSQKMAIPGPIGDDDDEMAISDALDDTGEIVIPDEIRDSSKAMNAPPGKTKKKEVTNLSVSKKPLDQRGLDGEILAGRVRESLPLDQREIIDQIKDSLPPILEELVKEYCQKVVENVAWEIIPDLAENLIKKELKDISKSIE